MNKAQLKALQAKRKQVYRDIEVLRKKHGEAALPALRKYLTDLAERRRRLDAIAQLRRELKALGRR